MRVEPIQLLTQKSGGSQVMKGGKEVLWLLCQDCKKNLVDGKCAITTLRGSWSGPLACSRGVGGGRNVADAAIRAQVQDCLLCPIFAHRGKHYSGFLSSVRSALAEQLCIYTVGVTGPCGGRPWAMSSNWRECRNALRWASHS